MAFKMKGFPMHNTAAFKKDEKSEKIKISNKEWDKKVSEMRDRNMSEAEIADIMKVYALERKNAPTNYRNEYGDDGLVKREHKEFNPEDTGWVDPYVESRLEAQEKLKNL